MRCASTRACVRTRNLGDVAICRQSAWGGRTKGGVVGAVSAVSAVGIGDVAFDQHDGPAEIAAHVGTDRERGGSGDVERAQYGR